MSTEKYIVAKSISDAIAIAERQVEGFRFVAGGTDVFVERKKGNDKTPLLVDISEIKELKTIEVKDNFLRIGAGVTLEQLATNEVVQSLFPGLKTASTAVASPVLRKTATVAGNLLCENRCTFYNQSEWWRNSLGLCLKSDGDICHATGGSKNCFSKLVSDLAVIFIALHAEVETTEYEVLNNFPVEELYSGDGINPHRLPKNGLLTIIKIPLQPKIKSAFKKLRVRKSVDFSSLSTAVSVTEKGEIRMVLGGVDPKPILIAGNIGQELDPMIKAAIKKARIVDNDVYPRWYRKDMIKVYLEKSLKELELV